MMNRTYYYLIILSMCIVLSCSYSGLALESKCASCHSGALEEVKQSVHGTVLGDEQRCTVCHSSQYEKRHYGKHIEDIETGFEVNRCFLCHGSDLYVKHGETFPQPQLHLNSRGDTSQTSCAICHVEEKDPHLIKPVKIYALKDCEECHSSDSILLTTPSKSSLKHQIIGITFTNSELTKKGQYVAGANRIPILDNLCVIIIILTIIGVFVIHGGVRFITRKRKGE
ncbi:MAG: hypothetical protein EMLJLAPB_00631 [Candidatus Argoarchaeum ethanivorans]|uniref:Tetrahaem cytochrome domain-containing protein n=1 Tax=Candidatus Argoarchaeum ethanivorans TaxID=2608793 RepID=A0A811TGE8_9EURY|nr:MAG: hypothetical protein EMLJLAPB_00631 [Candidatus Argoarchaeum ethanivorans]